jgi:hypothetical protein
MLEVTLSVLGANRRKRFAQHLYQGILRACSSFAQHTLDFAESLFYRIEVAFDPHDSGRPVGAVHRGVAYR